MKSNQPLSRELCARCRGCMLPTPSLWKCGTGVLNSGFENIRRYLSKQLISVVKYAISDNPDCNTPNESGPPCRSRHSARH